MLPRAMDQKSRRFPMVTASIILVNVIVFLFELGSDDAYPAVGRRTGDVDRASVRAVRRSRRIRRQSNVRGEAAPLSRRSD